MTTDKKLPLARGGNFCGPTGALGRSKTGTTLACRIDSTGRRNRWQLPVPEAGAVTPLPVAPVPLARPVPLVEGEQMLPLTTPVPAAQASLAERVEAGLAAAQHEVIVKGDAGGVKEKLTLPDGSRVFSKEFTPADMYALGTINARQMVDAEELAGLVGEALGAPVPKVYRRGDELRTFTEWVDGTALYTARRRKDGNERAEALLDSRAAQRLALLDLLVRNPDRHEANMVVTRDGGLVGIDNGLAWTGAQRVVETEADDKARAMLMWHQGPSHHFLNGDGTGLRLGDNPLAPSDVWEIRRRLKALSPAFDRRGRSDWLRASLVVLELLDDYATAERSIFDD